jgi:hypothetical protein
MNTNSRSSNSPALSKKWGFFVGELTATSFFFSLELPYFTSIRLLQVTDSGSSSGFGMRNNEVLAFLVSCHPWKSKARLVKLPKLVSVLPTHMSRH